MHCPPGLKFAKVRSEPLLIRSLENKALLNVGHKELDKYKEEREKQKKINQVIRESEEIKKDLNEIKMLLKSIIEQR